MTDTFFDSPAGQDAAQAAHRKALDDIASQGRPRRVIFALNEFEFEMFIVDGENSTYSPITVVGEAGPVTVTSRTAVVAEPSYKRLHSIP